MMLSIARRCVILAPLVTIPGGCSDKRDDGPQYTAIHIEPCVVSGTIQLTITGQPPSTPKLECAVSVIWDGDYGGVGTDVFLRLDGKYGLTIATNAPPKGGSDLASTPFMKSGLSCLEASSMASCVRPGQTAVRIQHLFGIAPPPWKSIDTPMYVMGTGSAVMGNHSVSTTCARGLCDQGSFAFDVSMSNVSFVVDGTTMQVSGQLALKGTTGGGSSGSSGSSGGTSSGGGSCDQQACNRYSSQCAGDPHSQAPCYCAAACACACSNDPCEQENRDSAAKLGTTCSY